jgi:hypothetical protein
MRAVDPWLASTPSFPKSDGEGAAEGFFKRAASNDTFDSFMQASLASRSQHPPAKHTVQSQDGGATRKPANKPARPAAESTPGQRAAGPGAAEKDSARVASQSPDDAEGSTAPIVASAPAGVAPLAFSLTLPLVLTGPLFTGADAPAADSPGQDASGAEPSASLPAIAVMGDNGTVQAQDLAAVPGSATGPVPGSNSRVGKNDALPSSPSPASSIAAPAPAAGAAQGATVPAAAILPATPVSSKDVGTDLLSGNTRSGNVATPQMESPAQHLPALQRKPAEGKTDAATIGGASVLLSARADRSPLPDSASETNTLPTGWPEVDWLGAGETTAAPAPANLLDPAAADSALPDGEGGVASLMDSASQIGGTGVAIMGSLMKNPQETNKVAGPGMKVLPVVGSGGADEKNLPVDNSVPVARGAEGRGTDLNFGFANGNDHGLVAENKSVLDSMDLPSLADARIRALDRAHDMMVLHSMRLVESKSDVLSVLIKPAVGTELSLELHQRADGVEAQATVLRGDPQFLSSHWQELQQRLEGRGIKLAPLGLEADSSANDAGYSYQQQQSPQEDAAQQASAFAEFAAAGQSGGATARLATIHDGWESWA